MKDINLFLGSSIFFGYPDEYSFVDMLKEDYLLLRDKNSNSYLLIDNGYKGKGKAYTDGNNTIIIESKKQCLYNGEKATLKVKENDYKMTLSDGKTFDFTLKKGDDNVVKKAVNGTSLACYTPKGASDDDYKFKSYLYRLTHDCDEIKNVDTLFVQLSTNDCNRIIEDNNVLGKILPDDYKEIQSFDQGTTLGAIEYIICYAKIRWGARVCFVTCPYINCDNDYSKCYCYLVDKLQIIKNKWDIGVIDLCNDKEIYDFIVNVDDEKRKIYQKEDRLHFTKDGYLKFFFPKLREYIDKNCQHKV